MPHERRIQQNQAGQAAASTQTASSRSERMPPQNQVISAFSQVQNDIRALNSSVLILSQKMQYLVRNEKILGRNLIVLSKRIRDMESGGFGANGQGAGAPETLEAIKELAIKIESHGQKILDIENNIADIAEHYAKNETLKEMKYVIDTINPMDFVTLKQVTELIDKKGSPKK